MATVVPTGLGHVTVHINIKTIIQVYLCSICNSCNMGTRDLPDMYA